jgi:NAD(P)-dependent dehydrogenase (short-subunit alcohol dehydrogenase family)
MKTAVGWLTAGAVAVGALRRLRRLGRRMSFAGASVLVTGGSRGLGLVLARRLVDEGAHVALLARDEDELARARADLEERGGEVLTLACDLRDEESAKSAVQQVIAHFGRLDVLINNAGLIQVGPIEHMSIEDFESSMAIHMWAPLHLMLAAIPKMRELGGGRIVNIASIGGRVAMPHLVPYVTSKFALVGLSEGMRAELSKHDIFVTTVCPFLMRTGSPVNADFRGHHEDEFTWFAVSDSLPLLSVSAERAAAKIIDAARHGDASPSVGVQSRILIVLDALFPELSADLLGWIDRMLPGKAVGGDQVQSGWESRSRWAPSVLTRLTDKAAIRNNEVPKKNGHIS